MSEHPFNVMNRNVVEVAEIAYAAGGMAMALKHAVSAAYAELAERGGSPAVENRDVINILYCQGKLVPIETINQEVIQNRAPECRG